MSAVGVVGLGNMGSGMAISLQRAGFEVIGTARSAETRARASTEGIRTVSSLAEVATLCEVVVLSLPTPEAVVQVVESEQGLKKHGRAGQLVIDTTTSDASTTRRLGGSLATLGIAFIDAPVSGAPEVARKGELAMMLGGEEGDVARALPVLQAMAKIRVHVGPLGAGNLTKLANNLMAAANLLIAAEIVEFAKKSGLDPESFLQVINASTGRSFATERVFPNWVLTNRFDLGFMTRLMRKDVRLAHEAIERLGLNLPLVRSAAHEWSTSARYVGDDEDVTRIAELPARRALAV